MKVSTLLAMQIGGSIDRSLNWAAKRDVIDQKTNGELDCIELDILTDLVVRFHDAA